MTSWKQLWHHIAMSGVWCQSIFHSGPEFPELSGRTPRTHIVPLTAAVAACSLLRMPPHACCTCLPVALARAAHAYICRKLTVRQGCLCRWMPRCWRTRASGASDSRRTSPPSSQRRTCFRPSHRVLLVSRAGKATQTPLQCDLQPSISLCA